MSRPRQLIRAVVALVLLGGAPIVAISPQVASAAVRPLLGPHIFVGSNQPTTADCEAIIGIACYSPNQIEQAYNMHPLFDAGYNGAGTTIGIVDAFGSPTIASDLATFDAEFGLPDPPSFQVIQPAGPVPAFDPTNDTMIGWAIETTLDVEYAHAMAPGANIVLAETPVAETQGVQGFPEIQLAENYMIDNGLVDVISQSFGSTEETFPNEKSIRDLRSAYKNARDHGVTVLASSGDAGSAGPKEFTSFFGHPVVGWPASDPLNTAVGGTQLFLDADGNRTSPDVVWNETFDPFIAGTPPSPVAGGGGVSHVFGRPDFQTNVAALVGARRGIPDISLSAAVDGGVLVFTSFDPFGPGFFIVGGTSEAAPEFAGVVAIADQVAGHSLGWLNPTLYKLGAAGGSNGIVDVTSGHNAVQYTNANGTFDVSGFSAGTGYDLASGWGTIDGAAFVAALNGGSIGGGGAG